MKSVVSKIKLLLLPEVNGELPMCEILSESRVVDEILSRMRVKLGNGYIRKGSAVAIYCTRFHIWLCISRDKLFRDTRKEKVSN